MCAFGALQARFRYCDVVATRFKTTIIRNRSKDSVSRDFRYKAKLVLARCGIRRHNNSKEP
jgi:hypothetical protein